MTLKQKIKQALFSFFKDEILKVVGTERVTIFTNERMNLIEVKSQVLVTRINPMRPLESYERAIKKGSFELLDQLGEYVEVKEIDTVENAYDNKLFELSLFVGVKVQ